MLGSVTNTPPVIAVVDDDESVREALPDLLGVLGYESLAFASAEHFLAANGVDGVHCLILDIGLPGMSGPQLQQELVLRGHSLPTVFITGRPDSAPLRGSLLKPFSEQELRAALEAALAPPDARH
jgi:FixJ family two-component response regulator